MTKDFKNEIENIDDSVNQVPEVNLRDIMGFFEIVSSEPTITPTRFQDQIKLYVDGSDFRIYFYDTNAKAWRYMYNYVHP